eukprot:scaffold13267_cov96-Isochrysis_galbana.AAC.3
MQGGRAQRRRGRRRRRRHQRAAPRVEEAELEAAAVGAVAQAAVVVGARARVQARGERVGGRWGGRRGVVPYHVRRAEPAELDAAGRVEALQAVRVAHDGRAVAILAGVAAGVAEAEVVPKLVQPDEGAQILDPGPAEAVGARKRPGAAQVAEATPAAAARRPRHRPAPPLRKSRSRMTARPCSSGRRSPRPPTPGTWWSRRTTRTGPPRPTDVAVRHAVVVHESHRDDAVLVGRLQPPHPRAAGGTRPVGLQLGRRLDGVVGRQPVCDEGRVPEPARVDLGRAERVLVDRQAHGAARLDPGDAVEPGDSPGRDPVPGGNSAGPVYELPVDAAGEVVVLRDVRVLAADGLPRRAHPQGQGQRRASPQHPT